MKISETVSYGAGFVAEVVSAGSTAAWNETTMTYRIVYVVSIGLVFLAAWVKPKPHKGNDTADNNPLHALEYEPSYKRSDSAAQG